MRKTTIAMTFVVLTATSLCAQVAGDRTLMQLINESLPADVGDRAVMQRLLNPRIARPQFGETFDPKTVDKTVGEQLQPDKGCPPFNKTSREAAAFRCDYRSQDGSFMRVDWPRGHVGYVNPKRSSNLMVNNTHPASRATSIAMSAFAALGIPADEINTRSSRAARLMVAARDDDDRRSAFTSDPEWHVGVKRHVGGVAVVDSRAVAVIDAQGAISRLYATWPNFAIEPGYSAEDTTSRQDVIAAILDRLGDTSPASISRLKSSIKYATVDRVEGADRNDAVPPGDPDRSTLYVPALEVSVFPVEQAEDSGVTQEAGEQFLIALLNSR